LKYLTYLTPSTGSLSSDFVTRVKAALPNIDVVNEETSGSLVVLSALQERKGDFGFSLADAAYLAYRHGIEPNASPYTNVRAIAVRWVNSFYAIVPRASPYRTLADLRGKRIAVMPRGSAGELLTRLMLEAHGLQYSDVKPSFIDTDEDRLTALREGRLDVVTVTATPVSNLLAEITRAGFRVIPIQREVVSRVRSQYPFVKVTPLNDEMAGGVDQITVGVDSVLVCRADLDEPIAYELTKAFYGLLSDLVRAQPSAAINPGNASATPIPLHPGAARFYREQEISNES
jgi:TRAP transporter TAXI family solute receptor